MTPITQLRSLARDCRAYQEERGLSDAAFCRKVSQCGSTKTYKRILDDTDDLHDLNVENQLANYQSAAAYIAILRRDELPPEPEYDSFTNVVSARAAVARAIIEPGIARFVVIQGENGTGKDAVKKALLKLYPNMAVDVEATELWRDTKDYRRVLNDVLQEFLDAVNLVRQGEKDGEGNKKRDFTIPSSAVGKLKLLLEELNKKKTILIINEGHHMGPGVLNLVKTIINQSPTVVVLECVPRLLRRLRDGNYEEAIQLFGNRLCEDVLLPSPPQDEIAEMFKRRGVKFEDEKTQNTACAVLASECKQFGNWQYVVKVIRECRAIQNGSALTMEKFNRAQLAERQRRLKAK